MINEADATKINNEYNTILRSLLSGEMVQLDAMTFSAVCNAMDSYPLLMKKQYSSTSYIKRLSEIIGIDLESTLESEFQALSDELGPNIYYLIDINKEKYLLNDLSKIKRLTILDNTDIHIKVFNNQPKIDDVNQVYVIDGKLYTDSQELLHILQEDYPWSITNYHNACLQCQINPDNIDI